LTSYRILYLIDRLHSTGGGAEGVIQKLCAFLPERGFSCSVATFWAGEGVEPQFPCPVHVFPISRMYGWSALRQAILFARLLRTERIDIVHTFFPASDLWGGMIARLAGCPILVSSRRDMGILRSRKHRLPYRFANRLFDQVQAVSDKVREKCILEDRLPHEKVVTVPNGIDLDALDVKAAADRRSAFHVADDRPIVATVANLRPVKGVDVLIRSAALVREQFKNVLFVVIGEAHDAIYPQELNALAERLGVRDNIRFMGRRNDVYELLKATNVFCLPSRSEGMSNALLEAMACRLPCVATDVGGNPEVVVDGRTGYLVPAENPSALADRLIRLLRDHERAKSMGEEGRRTVESKFTVQHMLQRLGFLYGNLLRRREALTAIPGEQLG
jgi:glycosyltransferase involved in cell wall biosynthesis